MDRVLKHYLKVTDTQTLQLRENFTILDVQSQGGKVVLWAEENDSNDLVDATFLLVGTGMAVLAYPRTHVGTVQIDSFVWHVYAI